MSWEVNLMGQEPKEIIRCLRICRSTAENCTDDDGHKCSYWDSLQFSMERVPYCMDLLIGDAADALAAIYLKKG